MKLEIMEHPQITVHVQPAEETKCEEKLETGALDSELSQHETQEEAQHETQKETQHETQKETQHETQQETQHETQQLSEAKTNETIEDQTVSASTTISISTCEDTCIDVSSDVPSQETNLLEDEQQEPKFRARQKLCSVVRTMQQQTIAEMFPIMESRETTEGSEDTVICRICHTCGDEILIAPCRCKGSAQFVHATCLLTWFKKSVKNHCELCQEIVPIRKKNRPVSEWKKPEDRPIPVIWFVVFFIGLCLNILSIQVNASENCNSTACVIFYVVNGFGILLDAAFLWFWWMKCSIFWKKWCAINQDWFIMDAKTSYVPALLRLRRSQDIALSVQDQMEVLSCKEHVTQV